MKTLSGHRPIRDDRGARARRLQFETRRRGDTRTAAKSSPAKRRLREQSPKRRTSRGRTCSPTAPRRTRDAHRGTHKHTTARRSCRRIRAGARAIPTWPKPVPRRSPARFCRTSASSRSTAIRSRSGWACSANIPPTRCSRSSTRTVAAWQKADPSTPVQPALHLVAVVAQGSARQRRHVAPAHGHGADREGLRLGEAARSAILFLDIQVGQEHDPGRAAASAADSSRAPTCISASIPSSRCTTSRKASAGQRRSARSTRPTSTTRSERCRQLVAREEPAAEGARRASLHAAHGARTRSRSSSIRTCRS